MDELRQFFEKAGRKQAFRRGNFLVGQEEEADCVLYLLKGEAEVRVNSPTSGEIALTILKEGEIFGELGVLAGCSRSATVKAKTDCEAVILHRDNFFLLLQREPEMARALLKILSRRIIRLTEQVKILGLKSGWKRVATALLYFEDYPEQKPPPLTNDYLARFCGVSERQAHRILQRFQQNGWVDFPPNAPEIQVKNRAGLQFAIKREGKGWLSVAKSLLNFEDSTKQKPPQLTSDYLALNSEVSKEQVDHILQIFHQIGWVKLPPNAPEIQVKNRTALQHFVETLRRG